MKKDTKYPSISVVIPVFNEEVNLKRLYLSLKEQNYPKNKIEYLVIDDGSTDSTAKISRVFGARVVFKETHDIGLNKRYGIQIAKNDLVYCIDADMEVCNKDFFKLLVKPFIEDPDIIASFTKEFALDGKDDRIENSLLRFISYHPLQQDPLYQFLSPSIESTVVVTLPDYFVCKFIPGKIPAVGRIMYRRKKLLEIAKKEKDADMDLDLETTVIVARAGFNKFAYVPKAKIRHHHATTLSLLIRKRLRNLKVNYLPNAQRKYYLWFDPNSPKDILGIIGWIIYANLIIPETIRGIIKSIYYKDLAFMWHPLVSITTTDAILWVFISRKAGRDFFWSITKRFLNSP